MNKILPGLKSFFGVAALMSASAAFCADAPPTVAPSNDTSAALASAPDPLNDPSVQKTLRAMSNASTWYHPDLFGEFAGMRYYAHHKYRDALKYFEIGAQYADKLSQLSIGLMYMNGEGMKKDLVTAYAWLDLAAERGYPDFVATRDAVKSQLSPQDLARAVALRAALGQRYADDVAKPRLIVQLRQGQMNLTGSRTGFDYGVSHLATGTMCGPAVVVGGSEVPQAGCAGGDVAAKERWDPKLYFASRDREYTATVTVGDVEPKGKALSAPPASRNPAAAPAPATQQPVDAPPDPASSRH